MATNAKHEMDSLRSVARFNRKAELDGHISIQDPHSPSRTTQNTYLPRRIKVDSVAFRSHIRALVVHVVLP